MLNSKLTEDTPFEDVEVEDTDKFSHLDEKSSSSFKASEESEEATVQCPSCNKTFHGNLDWIMEKHLPNCLIKMAEQKK